MQGFPMDVQDSEDTPTPPQTPTPTPSPPPETSSKTLYHRSYRPEEEEDPYYARRDSVSSVPDDTSIGENRNPQEIGELYVTPGKLYAPKPKPKRDREKYNKYMQKYMRERKLNTGERMFALIDMVEDLHTKLDSNTAAILSEVAGRAELSEKALERLEDRARENKEFMCKAMALKQHEDKAMAEKEREDKAIVTIKFEGKNTKWMISDVRELMQQLLDAKVAQNTLMGLKLSEEYNRANNYGKIVM
jgi:hypothetical protein